MCSAVDDGIVTDNSVHATAAIAPSKIAGTAATLSGDQTFAQGALHVDATNGRVGIGTTSPGVALEVNGAARIEGRRVPYSVVAQSCSANTCTATCPAGDQNRVCAGLSRLRRQPRRLERLELRRRTAVVGQLRRRDVVYGHHWLPDVVVATSLLVVIATCLVFVFVVEPQRLATRPSHS